MKLFNYMGHHHIVWCYWQGHSNGWKLRIGFKRCVETIVGDKAKIVWEKSVLDKIKKSQ